MTNYRKTGLMLLCLSMSISIFTACGSSSDKGTASTESSDTAAEVHKTGFPIVDNPIELSIMAPDVGRQDWNKMPVIQEYEKMTNIKLKIQNAPQDSFETKKNLVFASGTLPDIFYAADLKGSDQVTYGSQGLLLPLEKYIDEGYAPNLKKILDANPDIRKSMTTPDGHIYALRNIQPSAVWYRGPMWYNGKFLKKFGMENKLPQTTEELYNYLKKVKEEDANGNGKDDEVPLSSVKLDDLRMFFLGFWGMYNEDIYVDKENKVHFPQAEPVYKEYLTFLNRLWNENLLDHETFSQTDEQKKAKGKNNQVALFSDYFPYFTLGGEPSEDNPMMQPVSSDIAGTPVYGKHPGINTIGGFAISNTNPNPEASMRWIDYQFSEEGYSFWAYGPEGTLFKYKDKATGEKEWLPVPDGTDREEYRGTITPNYGINTPGSYENSYVLGLRTSFDDWIDKETASKLTPIAKAPFPSVFLTVDQQTEIKTLRSDLDKYVKEMEAKFVTGAEPLSNWDKYIAQMKKMGYEKLESTYQQAYDTWAAGK